MHLVSTNGKWMGIWARGRGGGECIYIIPVLIPRVLLAILCNYGLPTSCHYFLWCGPTLFCSPSLLGKPVSDGHSCWCKERAVPQSKSYELERWLCLMGSLTILLEFSLKNSGPVAVWHTFQGELLAFISVQNSNLKEEQRWCEILGLM